MLLRDDDWISECTLSLLKVEPARAKISEYVEGLRQMPDDSPFPGPWRNSMTPYLVEIMDDMSLYSPVQHEVLMCSAQIGKTAAAGNVVGYWMDENPTSVLWISGTEDLAEKWATHELDPLITSLGFRHKIGATRNDAKSRRTGDKVFAKEYIGGALHIVSAQSTGGIASMSKRVVVRDEIDRAPPELRSGEGNWLDVSMARTKAWRDRRKIFDCSTPSNYDTSEIFRLYQMGDCRKYQVPCPHCEHFQELELGDGKGFGLRPIFKNGKLSDVVYVCRYCSKEIHEYHRLEMLQKGFWKPTRESNEPYLVSRHINALYAPYQMYSWITLYRGWIDAQNDSERMKAFMNTELGLPYQEEGSRPDDQVMLAHAGHYAQGEIQRGLLYISAGMDAQRGRDDQQWIPVDSGDTSKGLRPPDNAKPDEGPRLEVEILGHGEDYRSWSLVYKKFYGPVNDPFSGAWEDFYQWCANPDQSIHKGPSTTFLRVDDYAFPICGIFIDSGTLTDIVYRFCSRAQVFVPAKGVGWISDAKAKLKGDVPGPLNARHYSSSSVPGSDKEIYTVSTNYYKGEFYNRMRILRQQMGPNPPGYCDFPASYDERHYEQLNAETKWKSDGSFHPVKVRNEALDCRVYAMASGESYLMGEVKANRDVVRKGGGTERDIAMVTPKWLLARWAAKIWGNVQGEGK